MTMIRDEVRRIVVRARAFDNEHECVKEPCDTCCYPEDPTTFLFRSLDELLASTPTAKGDA